ncbi:MAG: transcriptional repressor [candidate division Zixibacteria bacterium]|nr:transcriptional repressor [candidate division Zixibacteria bacterium]
MKNNLEILKRCGVRPTPQRIAVVKYIFESKGHPDADTILENVRKTCPTISRATVYNTLNLLVAKGLLQTQILKGRTVIFDPNTQKHHHFVDDATGKVFDIPWDTLKVSQNKTLQGFQVRDYQVIMRGRRES